MQRPCRQHILEIYYEHWNFETKSYISRISAFREMIKASYIIDIVYGLRTSFKIFLFNTLVR